MADLASEAKKQAKKIAGNSYFINQRRNPKILERPQSKRDTPADFYAWAPVIKLHALH